MNDHDRPPPSRLLIALAFAAVYILWGSTYLGMRMAVRTLPPFLLASARFFVAGSVILCWNALAGGPRPTALMWKNAARTGAWLLLGGNGGVVWAVQRIPSGIAAVVVSVLPLWIVLLEWVRGRGRPTGRVAVGVVMGLVGVVLLSRPGSSAAAAGHATIDPIGVGVVVLASLSWAIGTLDARRSQVPGAPLLGAGLQMVAGGSYLLVLGLVTGEPQRLAGSHVSTTSMLALGYLIVFGSLIAYSAYVWLLQVVPAARVATYAYVNPVVAVFLGWAIADEPLTPRMLIAAAVIIAAVVMVTAAPPRGTRPR
jgi:drug/metabolite transporter (DMT)-like permease